MRSLSIFALLVSASLASAATIPFSCAPNNNNAVTNAALVNAGSTSVTCTGFDAGAGFLITDISFNFLGTYQDSVNNGNHQLTFSVLTPYSSFGPLISTIDPAVGFAAASNTGAGTPGVQSIAAFLVTVTTSNTNGANALPDNGSYTVSGTYTYTTQQNGVPEPSTLALVGGVLVLAGLRKFRS